jgi:hypothetical protein
LVRNPWATFLVPVVCFALAPPLGYFFGTTAFRFAPSAAIIAGTLIFAMHTWQMLHELKSISGDAPTWWHILIPIYGLYVAAVLVPKQLAKAKKLRNKPPPRSAVVYLFFFLYAFAADLNDLAA